MKRASVLFFALVLASSTIGVTTAAPVHRAAELTARNFATADYCMEPEEQAMLALINDYRVQNGLRPLVASQMLGAAAKYHSMDMAATDYYSHTLSDGTTYQQNIKNFGYTYSTYLGENIAAGSASAQMIFDAWKGSPGHNTIMLYDKFGAIGIGRSTKDSNRYYWTATFGGVVDGAARICGGSPPPLTNSPTPLPTSTPTSVPTNTPTPIPTSTPTKVPTNPPTPAPTNTPTPTRTSTPSPLPTNTPTPLPTNTSTPLPTNTATAIPTTVPPTAAPAMITDYVAYLTSTASTRRGKTTITTKVTVKDDQGRLVSGAVVSMSMRGPDGSTQALSATTNGKGVASVAAPATAGSGMYTTSVGDVSKPGYVYDPSANRASSASVAVP